MAARVLLVKVFKPSGTWAERTKRLTWCTSARGTELETAGLHTGYKEKLDAVRRN